MRKISIIAGLLLLSAAPLVAEESADPIEMIEAVDYQALEILYRQGRAAVNRGEFRTAVMAADAMLAQDPMYADALVLRGLVSRETGQQRTAYDHYDAALQLEPDHLVAQSLLGQLFLDIGRVDRARTYLAALEALCPFGCGPAHALRQAINQFEKGAWIAPGNPAATRHDITEKQSDQLQTEKTKEE